MAREPGDRRERILASAAALFARKGVSAAQAETWLRPVLTYDPTPVTA